MSEKPILFSNEMVQAILAGRKTQTRRVMKPQPEQLIDAPGWFVWKRFSGHTLAEMVAECPYGKSGDLLWVREAWRTYKSYDSHNATWIAEQCLAAGYKKPWAPIEYRDGGRVNWLRREEAGRWRSSRFMPRWASRLILHVTSVRVERLQDISEEDAEAEGVELDIWDQALVACDYSRKDRWFQSWSDDGYTDYVPMDEIARASFRTLWNSINGKRHPWDSNPWVYTISFRKID